VLAEDTRNTDMAQRAKDERDISVTSDSSTRLVLQAETQFECGTLGIPRSAVRKAVSH